MQCLVYFGLPAILSVSSIQSTADSHVTEELPQHAKQQSLQSVGEQPCRQSSSKQRQNPFRLDNLFGRRPCQSAPHARGDRGVLTVPDILFVDLAIGLDDAKTVADGVGNDRSREPDKCLPL